MKIRLSGNDSNVYATSVRFMRQIFFQIRDEFVRVAFILPIARVSRDSRIPKKKPFFESGYFSIYLAHIEKKTRR